MASTCTFLYDPRISGTALQPDAFQKAILAPLREAIAALPDYSTSELRKVIASRITGN